MGRRNRQWTSQNSGSFHVISRITGQDRLLGPNDKEYFLQLLERFASGFFVQIHSFAILDNHFHILLTGLNLDAQQASKKELLQRYQRLYPKEFEPPPGSYRPDGTLVPDEDNGIERLRERLGSVSRFVQELKQTYSRWYNKNNNRKGYLWSDRFKGVIVQKGEAQLLCSAYIDLNAVRANIVGKPEDYRWCSLGLRVRAPKRARKLLTWFPVSHEDAWENIGLVKTFHSMKAMEWYRVFVYQSGGKKLENEDKVIIPDQLVSDVADFHGKLGIGEKLQYRLRNLSEGIAIGNYSFIAEIQKKYARKFIRPRSFLEGNRLFVTRVLRL
jgi:putative transposase